MNSDFYKIAEFKELQKLPKAGEARNILQQLIRVVSPILIRRQWYVASLKEFYPKNQSLLGMNVNRGACILVRLRSSKSSESFLPWHSILGTMIHELVHNEIGSHSAQFYQLMDELWNEVEKDPSSFSNSTETPHQYNFDGKFQRIGGFNKGTNPFILAAEAALRRKQRATAGCGCAADQQQTQEGSSSGLSLKERMAEAALKRASANNSSGFQTFAQPCGGRNLPLSFPQPSNTVIDAAEEMTSWVCGICTEKNTAKRETPGQVCVWCGQGKGSRLQFSPEVEIIGKKRGRGLGDFERVKETIDVSRSRDASEREGKENSTTLVRSAGKGDTQSKVIEVIDLT